MARSVGVRVLIVHELSWRAPARRSAGQRSQVVAGDHVRQPLGLGERQLVPRGELDGIWQDASWAIPLTALTAVTAVVSRVPVRTRVARCGGEFHEQTSSFWP